MYIARLKYHAGGVIDTWNYCRKLSCNILSSRQCIILTGNNVVEKPYENQTPNRSTSDVVYVISGCKLHHLPLCVATQFVIILASM
jgi:hypothetical protein